MYMSYSAWSLIWPFHCIVFQPVFFHQKKHVSGILRWLPPWQWGAGHSLRTRAIFTTFSSSVPSTWNCWSCTKASKHTVDDLRWLAIPVWGLLVVKPQTLQRLQPLSSFSSEMTDTLRRDLSSLKLCSLEACESPSWCCSGPSWCCCCSGVEAIGGEKRSSGSAMDLASRFPFNLFVLLMTSSGESGSRSSPTPSCCLVGT